MREKTMVNDALSMLNSSLTSYGSIIAQTENQELRRTLQNIRNSCENSQYELYQLAAQKGYYQAASEASSDEIQAVRDIFRINTDSMTETTNEAAPEAPRRKR